LSAHWILPAGIDIVEEERGRMGQWERGRMRERENRKGGERKGEGEREGEGRGGKLPNYQFPITNTND
jgi:hypothetical protein